MQEIWHKHIDIKSILLDGPVCWNLKHSLLVGSTGLGHAPLLSPATALCHRRLQTRNEWLDFGEFLPAKLSEGKQLHLRPIENCWSALKQAVYAGPCRGLPGQVPQCFAAHRINAKIYKVDQHIIINLFSSIKEFCQIRSRWTLLDLQINWYFPI